MLSKLSPEKREEILTKNRNCSLLILIVISYFISMLLLYFSIEEYYKMRTYLMRQCKLLSIDLIYQNKNYYPKWNLLIIHQNETTFEHLIHSIGSKSDRWASIKANKYKINETYLCYRSRNETSIIQWTWQWDKPNQFKLILLLLISIFFFLIGSILIKFKKLYQIKLNSLRKENPEQELTPMNNEQTA